MFNPSTLLGKEFINTRSTNIFVAKNLRQCKSNFPGHSCSGFDRVGGSYYYNYLRMHAKYELSLNNDGTIDGTIGGLWHLVGTPESCPDCKEFCMQKC